MLLQNTAEGGTDETTVTSGNSGGASGDALNWISGTDFKFDNAQAAHGTMSYRFGGSSSYAGWNFTQVTRVYGRCYLRLAATGTAVSAITGFAGGYRFRIYITSTPQLQLVAGNATVVATGATTLSVGTWYRVEWDITSGSSQFGEVKLFLGDSTTTLETLSGTSNYGGSAGVQFVVFGNETSVIGAPTIWFDDLVVNDTGYPGPASGGVAAAAPLPRRSAYRRHMHLLTR